MLTSRLLPGIRQRGKSKSFTYTKPLHGLALFFCFNKTSSPLPEEWMSSNTRVRTTALYNKGDKKYCVVVSVTCFYVK